MAKSLKSLLENKMKESLPVQVETLATGDGKSAFAGNIVAVGDDYVTLKREGYAEDIVALRHIVRISPIHD